MTDTTNAVHTALNLFNASQREGTSPDYFNPETGELTFDGGAAIAQAISVLSHASWKMSESKGFHESGRGFGEVIALIHSEISEALESNRSGEPLLWFKREDGTKSTEPFDENYKPLKAEGEAAEFADAFIRIGDWAGDDDERITALLLAIYYKNRFNATRPYKHGRKF